MLGRAVVKVFASAGDNVSGWDVSDGDLADEKTAMRAVESTRPDLVINCAGFTDVEACEDAFREAEVKAGNVLVPRFLARACEKNFVPMIHISTDYVFDGDKEGPYVESDVTNPVSQYGKSKLEGEIAVTEELPRAHLILRTAWLYGPHGRNFIDTIRGAARTRKSLRVVDDQIGCPTFVFDLAEAILACARARCTGILNAVNAGQTTWYGLTKKIMEISGASGVSVQPCSTDQYPAKAKRPKNSVLSCEKLAQTTGFRFRPWQEALEAYLTGSYPGGDSAGAA